MKTINELIMDLRMEKNITLGDVPEIDLYMDQVIQLFEKKFGDTTRTAEEKVLTKTMINNYAKGKLFFPIKNKKYSKEHLLIISLIYQLKGALSIGDIKNALEPINKKLVEDDDFNLEEFYEGYLQLAAKNGKVFKQFVHDQVEEAIEVAAQLGKEGEVTKDLNELLLILSFAQMSNFYRRIAERMIDERLKSMDK
ncbi:hypothetical protein J2S74_003957 [Evansella vedderi]|uniref:DUF1836 domain-containing protein n=1 Tax=Evansella vedderi TaxID=38282 RepID=A0ABT9ZZ67_9BACI|nr:DUF1836 domain-containing protein [Evansella vedderi]MDQ0256537.1 hypothetical protein [Evansella vedderi]